MTDQEGVAADYQVFADLFPDEACEELDRLNAAWMDFRSAWMYLVMVSQIAPDRCSDAAAAVGDAKQVLARRLARIII